MIIIQIKDFFFFFFWGGGGGGGEGEEGRAMVQSKERGGHRIQSNNSHK